ncbi:hypothetical protein L227DRAFT_56469 [Lentinus tigrinus ALCF2SS1-6]|uniref:Uncharacterized protein n=1 Tax=Lentinus tigrinus ALCF2SS1-6 TaxID=1328759 RepID=A0A5C2SD89_9APHY|nr:hypothetical protein L227DRAFT_56469 [Lentinus tigrinus ALCF2SS1-6]
MYYVCPSSRPLFSSCPRQPHSGSRLHERSTPWCTPTTYYMGVFAVVLLYPDELNRAEARYVPVQGGRQTCQRLTGASPKSMKASHMEVRATTMISRVAYSGFVLSAARRHQCQSSKGSDREEK